MSVSDKEKTTFITPRGAYCYKVMPFRLKNAEATYQRMVTTMFGHLIGKTVDDMLIKSVKEDMLIKSVKEEDHLTDLQEVLEILRRNELHFNASKCTFRVGLGKFLGHIISCRGI